jgi:hypothetical protein
VRYLGPPTSLTSYADGFFQLQPPGNARPSITWQQAFAACKGREATCGSRSGPDITLGLVSLPRSGAVAPNTLAYLLIWRDERCPLPAGPAPVATATSAKSCEMITVIDAHTGRSLFTEEGATTA